MDEDSTITIGDAYRSMVHFLEAYWQRGNRATEDDPIASMLSDLQFGRDGPTKTADSAQWFDWLETVQKVTK